MIEIPQDLALKKELDDEQSVALEQYREAIEEFCTIVLETYIKPMVRIIDDWFNNLPPDIKDQLKRSK